MSPSWVLHYRNQHGGPVLEKPPRLISTRFKGERGMDKAMVR